MDKLDDITSIFLLMVILFIIMIFCDLIKYYLHKLYVIFVCKKNATIIPIPMAIITSKNITDGICNDVVIREVNVV